MRNTMFKGSVDIFNKVASEQLPETLYNQLRPHIEPLMKNYDDLEALIKQMRDEDYIYSSRKMAELRHQFNEENEKFFAAFARKHWPEVDEYYNLDPEPKPEEDTKPEQERSPFDNDDIPF